VNAAPEYEEKVGQGLNAYRRSNARVLRLNPPQMGSALRRKSMLMPMMSMHMAAATVS